MNSAEAYIASTRSAIDALFNGINAYKDVLSSVSMPIFSGSSVNDGDNHELLTWVVDNTSSIQASLEAQRRFAAEKYALSVLCGSILNVAFCALREFSTQAVIPSDLRELPAIQKYSSYCVGRRVRGIPIGLIVYAARNAYNHYDDERLRNPSESVFDKLATWPCANCGFKDPLFDSQSTHRWILSSNTIELLEWRCFRGYERDMRHMLSL